MLIRSAAVMKYLFINCPYDVRYNYFKLKSIYVSHKKMKVCLSFYFLENTILSNKQNFINKR